MYNEFRLFKKTCKFLRLCAGRYAFPPEDIAIEVSTLCDRTCSICFRNTLRLEKGVMDLETFKLTAARIKEAFGRRNPAYLNLVGLGEPFLNPDLPAILAHIRSVMPDTRINVSSNLVSAPEKTLEDVLDRGLIDRLSVSIDLPDDGRDELHTFTPLLRARLASAVARAGAGDKKLSVRVHSIILSGEQVTKIIGICAGAGVDILHLTRLNTHHLKEPSLRRVTKKEELEIVASARREAAASGIAVWNNNDFNVFMRLASRRDKICLLSDDHLFINAQAEVLPCFFLRGVKLGSLRTQSLRDIFSGPEKKGFYQAQKDLCGGCDVYKEHYRH